MCSTSDSSSTVADRPTAWPSGPAELSRPARSATATEAAGEPLALQGLAEQVAQLPDLVVVDGVAQFDDALVHLAGVGDDHHQQPGRGEATTSRRRTVEADRVGYCTTATCLVSWASNRTARRSTSSRSTPSQGRTGSRGAPGTTAA